MTRKNLTVDSCGNSHPHSIKLANKIVFPLARIISSMSGSSAVDRERLAVDMRVTARHLFEHALAEASIDRAFQRHVECERGVMRVCEDLYQLDSYSRVLVIALGKAATGMVNSLEMQAGKRFDGIIATSIDPGPPLHGFRYFHGGHPTPNHESVRAANAMLKSLFALDSSCLVIFLLSGGGSSIAEKPIHDEISLPDLIATYRALVHSGAPITEINAIRKHLSAIKGGRLAQAASGAWQVSMFVSDVPDNTPDALASGPSMPDSSTIEDCYAIAQQHDLLRQFPDSVRELFERRALEETPKSDDPAFQRSRWWTLLSNQALLEASKTKVLEQGFRVEMDNSCDDWDYERASSYLVNRLRELRKDSERACLISGGEVTVTVRNGGVGGRNQHFALSCTEKITGENITVLSAGSDGIDGNSPASGAVVDGTTLARAQGRGLDPAVHLKSFNAYPFFQALGDAIVTGPTGNNLRDLRILMAY
jgi:glycerate 2-kinase